jgi:hypothetical protein
MSAVRPVSSRQLRMDARVASSMAVLVRMSRHSA